MNAKAGAYRIVDTVTSTHLNVMRLHLGPYHNAGLFDALTSGEPSNKKVVGILSVFQSFGPCFSQSWNSAPPCT